MKHLLSVLALLCCSLTLGQEIYEIDPKYPVHDLNTHLRVYEDSLGIYTPEIILNNYTLSFQKGDELPRMLKSNVTYWGMIVVKTKNSLEDWKLHFEDKMIGPPEWTKSNGKVDVFAYSGNRLLFNQKTGVDYPKSLRSNNDHWVLNTIDLSAIPPNKIVTLIIKAEGNSMGYPPYFNLSARSPSQTYYHQIYQFNNSFNIFMFGVTFIIFLYHLLQFVYLRDRVYFWFSLWLLVVMLTHAMTIGIFIGMLPEIRFYFWMIIANSIFFTFWFFGRSFIESKKKFPVLDKFILGLAFFVIIEIALTALYVMIFNPIRDYKGPGIHLVLLNVYAIGSLILSIVIDSSFLFAFLFSSFLNLTLFLRICPTLCFSLKFFILKITPDLLILLFLFHSQHWYGLDELLPGGWTAHWFHMYILGKNTQRLRD